MTGADLLEGTAARNAAASGARRSLLPVRAWHLLKPLSVDPWRSAVLGAAICSVMAIGYWWLAPRTYRAHATVAPTVQSGMSRLPGALSGIAGQLGLGAGTDPTNTPLFYALLGTGESIQRQVLFTEMPPSPTTKGKRRVWQSLGVAPCDSVCILRHALPRLASAVDIVVDRQTGTFEISAVMKDPFDAAAIVELYIAAIEHFNRGVRRTQAKARREFVEDRLSVVRNELHSAETGLQAFYEHNAQWRTSPRLTVEEGRLQRVIDSRSQLFNELVQQLEAARLDEVNSTPLLSIIDSPTPPVRKYAPRGLPLLIGALVTGGLLGLVGGIIRVRRW